MKNILMLYHWEIFTGIWHCLFIDQKKIKRLSEPVFTQLSLFNLWKGTLHGADKCYLYLFVKLSNTVFCLILS